jgi:hypothetical protein
MRESRARPDSTGTGRALGPPRPHAACPPYPQGRRRKDRASIPRTARFAPLMPSLCGQARSPLEFICGGEHIGIDENQMRDRHHECRCTPHCRLPRQGQDDGADLAEACAGDQLAEWFQRRPLLAPPVRLAALGRRIDRQDQPINPRIPVAKLAGPQRAARQDNPHCALRRSGRQPVDFAAAGDQNVDRARFVQRGGQA